MSEVQKDSEDVFAGIGIFKIIKLLNKFSRNLRSKSARSTLTSPGPIRVNCIPGQLSHIWPRTFQQLKAQNNILFCCVPTTCIPQLASWQSSHLQVFIHEVSTSITKPWITLKSKKIWVTYDQSGQFHHHRGERSLPFWLAGCRPSSVSNWSTAVSGRAGKIWQ